MNRQVETRIINMEQTGKQLQVELKRKGIKVTEIADILLTSPQAVYKWLNGKALPSIDNLLNLAGMLETSIEKLLVYEVYREYEQEGEERSSPSSFFRYINETWCSLRELDYMVQ